MKELIKKNWDYILSEDEDGTFVLSVLYGSFAMYVVKIRLNEVETAEYLKRGQDFIEELASRIRSSPGPYSDRAIR